jgi:M6 family metalloprotease-like protein
MRLPPVTPAAAAAILLAGIGTPMAAQDVEMLGEYYGTLPPSGYFAELDRDPRAFQFDREGLDRLTHIQRLRGARFPELILHYGAEVRSIGPRDEPIVGEFRFPLVLGTFADSPAEPPFSRGRVQEEYFDGPNSHYQTVTEFYDEMSQGRMQLAGVAYPWVQTELTQVEVTRNNSGLVSHRTQGIGNFIVQILRELDDEGVDWSQYDNTGDGFVDVLTVMHPTHGAECRGEYDIIWSHRWTISSATRGGVDREFAQGFRTSTPRPDGSGFIHINDYTVQAVRSCDRESINEIGVYAHELGHGLGLPDLYGTQWFHPGVGSWDLMATGAWGCRGDDPARPCHMGAWSKSMLGWVDVTTPEGDEDHGTVTLPPVQTSGQVLRLDVQDGSREYLLLENRQRVGSDVDLWEPGLLIWHVDPDEVEWRWPDNIVNRNHNHLGVWLRQADGKNELVRNTNNHGDRGDPFPGCIQGHDGFVTDRDAPCEGTNPVFHAGSRPAAHGHGGGPMGVTLRDIELVGDEPHDVRFRMSTRFSRIVLGVEMDGESTAPPGAPFQADDQSVPGEPATLLAAPFQELVLQAPPGADLEDGVRVGFQGWSDGEPRIRDLVAPAQDTTLVATYGGEEVRLKWIAESSRDDLVAGTIETDPGSQDLWFPRGTTVTLEALARQGFTFLHWVGELDGAPNPYQLTMDGPRTAHAAFSFDYGFVDPPSRVVLEGAAPVDLRFEVENGTDPIRWSIAEGQLPDGVGFQIPTGRFTGAPLRAGSFPVRVRAVDDNDLHVETDLVLDVLPPALSMEALTAALVDGGEELTSLQVQFLDRSGNENGRYDVGDLRRLVRAFPDLLDGPVTSEASASSRTIRLRLPESIGEERR